MNNYEKVYKDAVKVHDEIKRVKQYREAALDCLEHFACLYSDPDENEFVKNAITAAYEPRIDNLLKEFFCTAREENKAAAEEPKDKIYYEFDLGACSITVDSDVFNKAHNDCYTTNGYCDVCDLKDIPACICTDLQDRYRRGEYRIIRDKEE